METKLRNYIRMILREQLENQNISIEYAASPTDDRIKEIHKIATDYFGTETDETQLPATQAATNHAFNIGGIHTLAVDKENGDLVGWGFSIPTTQKLMYEYLNNKITEAELFWNTKKGNYDAIYFVSVFVKPEYRNLSIALKLINKSVEPLYKNGMIIFYDAFSKEGAGIGNYLKSHYKGKVISKKEWGNF